MGSRCQDCCARVLACALAMALSGAAAAARDLTVCADPANLPYSDAAGQGFENRIARLIAADLDARLRYYWISQWRGFTRNTLLEGRCDVIPGVPADHAGVLATDPYYRGEYAFAFRADRVPGLNGLDDPRLRTLRIGLPLVGGDAVPTPPGRALARRGIFDNVVGFAVIGDKPVAERMIAALANGELDVAIIWSPQMRYFIARQRVPLAVAPLGTSEREPSFEGPIAMGVRPDDIALQRALNASLARLRSQIEAVLAEFGVTPPGDDLALGQRR